MNESQEPPADSLIRHNSSPAEATGSAMEISACGLQVAPKEPGLFHPTPPGGVQFRGDSTPIGCQPFLRAEPAARDRQAGQDALHPRRGPSTWEAPHQTAAVHCHSGTQFPWGPVSRLLEGFPVLNFNALCLSQILQTLNAAELVGFRARQAHLLEAVSE